jgi:GT2 family glycosyltransferase
MAQVDVIIVNFNAGAHLVNCVKSVLTSTIPVKIFISDNDSTDQSLALLEQSIGHHPQVFIHKNEKNLGFSRGNNIMLDKTSADYLLFLNPDCILRSDTLQPLVAEFNKRPRVGMIGCLIRNTDNTEQVGCRRNIPTPWRALVRMLRLYRWMPKHRLFDNFILTDQSLPQEPTLVEGISGAFMLVHRKAIDQVGALDENYFLHCEDLDWFMRFKLKKWDILFVPQVAITHVKGVCSQNTWFKVLWYKHAGMMRFYRKFFRKPHHIILRGIVNTAILIRFVTLAIMFFLTHWQPPALNATLFKN